MNARFPVLLCFAAGMIVNSGPALAFQAPQRTSEGDKPVEQVRKNIQVLKGLPASQLNLVMDDMATSLGVRCGHCHSGEGRELQFEKDDKPAKGTARKMIQMVMNLNANSFGGRAAVTCYTCHRGSTEPPPMMPLPQPPIREMREDRETTPSLPDAENVLSALGNALGGAEAMKKITSRITKGVSVDQEGRESPFRMIQEAPDKLVSTVTIREGMVLSHGFDGSTAWMSSPRGTRQMPPEAAAGMKREASLFPIEHLRELSSALHVVGKDTIRGSVAYILAAPAGNNVTERYYVDSAAGLLLRMETVTETMIGDIPRQVDYDDYRTVDGVKIPFKVVTAAPDPRDNTVERITSVEQNVAVDEKEFKQPQNNSGE